MYFPSYSPQNKKESFPTLWHRKLELQQRHCDNINFRLYFIVNVLNKNIVSWNKYKKFTSIRLAWSNTFLLIIFPTEYLTDIRVVLRHAAMAFVSSDMSLFNFQVQNSHALITGLFLFPLLVLFFSNLYIDIDFYFFLTLLVSSSSKFFHLWYLSSFLFYLHFYDQVSRQVSSL